MIDPRETGRPLDAREAREFDRLVAAFDAPPAPHREAPDATASPAAPAPPDPEHRPLTWRQVVLVLAASAVVAALTATLPVPLNLWAPVVVLVVLSLACVVWGRRAERPRRR